MMNIPQTNISTKASKARHSMPVFANLKGHPGMGFPQGQHIQNQFGYQNMNNMYNPSSENLFNIEESPQEFPIPYQKGGYKGHSRPLSNNYQPNMYMNPNIQQTSDQTKQPYNFSAQINLSKRKAEEQENVDPKKNYGGIDNNIKQVPYVPLKNNQNEGLDGKNKEENLQEITKRHEELITLILAEEEEVISSHRQQIDDMVDLIKQVILSYE